MTPHEQFAGAQRSLLNRWLEESDLGDDEIAQIAIGVAMAWMEEDVVTFEDDDGLFGDGQAPE